MNRQDTSTGAIVIASLIITVMLIVWVGGQNTLIGGRAYEVFFPVAADLGGIGEGDPVRLGGHTISKVESVDVEIPSDNPDKPVVVVGFRLPDSVPLRNGAQVEVQTSFTGVASLNITSIGVGDLLDAGDRLAGQASSIQRITEAITSLAPDISAAVDEIRTKIVPEITEAADAFQMTLAEANATLEAYRGVAEQVQADDGTLARLNRAILGLDDTIEKIGLNVDRVGLDVSTVVQDFRAEDGLMVQLESGVASFEEAMSSLGIVFGEGGPDLTSAAGSIREAADGLPLAVGELRAAFEDLRRELNDDSGTLATIREAAGKADSALEEVRSLLARNRDQVDQTMVAARSAVEEIRLGMTELRAEPWKLLAKSTNADETAYVIRQATRDYAEAARNLEGAASRFRNASQSSETSSEELIRLAQAVDASMSKFQDIERALFLLLVQSGGGEPPQPRPFSDLLLESLQDSELEN